MDAQPAAQPPRFGGQPMLYGRAEVRRSQRHLRYELVRGNQVVAALARYSWLNIFFGPGQRVVLPSGERWRIRSYGRARHICPLIVDEDGRRVAVSAPSTASSYGINGKDWALSMFPGAATNIGRANSWLLREHETELAVVRRKPRSIDAYEPIPVSAALLALVLAQFDMPGEKELWQPPAN
ncbi:MAG: hypothetical protein OEM22_02820 [Acidimicrobiia bacterium]|nr:hypothetical protein [Acidimicrobiia bacterium]MDH3470139.1 hypothetical protein [Acidimicrobiia bacterium]